MFLYILGWVLNELCLTFTIRPYWNPVWPALQPGLDPDVQPVRAKVMGMNKGSMLCEYTQIKTTFNEKDDFTASIFFFFNQGNVD